MKKKIILICALILCFGLGIIIGLKLNNSKKEDNSKRINNNTNINTSKYTKKIEELEKKLEESNKKNESYNNSLKDNNKTTNELLDIIEKAQFEDNGYQYIVDNVMDSFYRYAAIHTLPYCGEHGEEEFINDEKILGDSSQGGYRESYTFKNKDDVNDFFLEFLSDDYYNNRIKKYYVEKDNKLYCFAPGKGALFYKPEESDFKVITISDNKIEVFAKTISENIGTDQKIDAYATLIKENNNWVVDEYMEFR